MVLLFLVLTDKFDRVFVHREREGGNWYSAVVVRNQSRPKVSEVMGRGIDKARLVLVVWLV